MLDISKGQFFREVFRDFEGMADGKKVLALCKVNKEENPHTKNLWAWDMMCEERDSEELRKAVRGIGLNLLYEMADTGGIENISENDVYNVFYAVREVLVTPKWSEVTNEDIERIENAPDEDDNEQG